MAAVYYRERIWINISQGKKYVGCGPGSFQIEFPGTSRHGIRTHYSLNINVWKYTWSTDNRKIYQNYGIQGFTRTSLCRHDWLIDCHVVELFPDELDTAWPKTPTLSHNVGLSGIVKPHLKIVGCGHCPFPQIWNGQSHFVYGGKKTTSIRYGIVYLLETKGKDQTSL